MSLGRRIGLPGAALTAVLAWLIASAPAGATTLRRMDLPDLVGAADRIVHARTVETRVYWDPTHTRIYTDSVFEVLGEAKGQGPKRLTVTLLGGRIDPVEMTVPGTPVFRPGDEAVLFTELLSDGTRSLVGLGQGLMRVHDDPATGGKFAVSEALTGVTLVPGGPGRPAGAPQRGVAPLEKLLEEIRRMAGGQRRAGPRVSRTPAAQSAGPDGSRP